MCILQRLCEDPSALVETYLNYDCDRTAVDNMFQRLIEDLSKISAQAVMVSPMHQQQYEEQNIKNNDAEWQGKGTLPPPLSTAHISSQQESESEIPKDYIIK